MARERLEVFAMQKGWYRSSGRYLERRRWTTEDAQAALADLDASGLELAAIAREAGLEPQRLKRWRRALEGFATDAVFEEVVGEPSAMAMRIGVTTDGARGWFEVVLASGRVVRVPASFDAAALGRLLAVVVVLVAGWRPHATAANLRRRPEPPSPSIHPTEAEKPERP